MMRVCSATGSSGACGPWRRKVSVILSPHRRARRERRVFELGALEVQLPGELAQRRQVVTGREVVDQR
jgi:hypothetical protein